MNNNIKIDFVLPWVDDSDPKWREEKKKFQQSTIDESNSDIRYRDWDLLKYWFRAIETNAPWVNKIFFITCGQKPEWLDESNEKLVLINHADYIDSKLLPTFNINVIEDNIHRIDELSEHFVYFNDDMYIINKTKKQDFFKKNLPCDSFCFNAVSAKKDNNIIEHNILNDGAIIEKYFTKNKVLKKNFSKILNPKYGIKNNIKSLLLTPWKNFTGIYNPHVPCPYLKSSMRELWDLEKEALKKGSSGKFRSKDDINIWVFRYWNLFNGRFTPYTTKKSYYYDICTENSMIEKIILGKKYKLICLNDSDQDLNFEKAKKELIEIFEKKFPTKSSFEK